MKEGRRIPSWVHLNPSCLSPPGPSGPALWGREGGPQQWEGENKGRESVEGENEQTLILFPGDLWS